MSVIAIITIASAWGSAFVAALILAHVAGRADRAHELIAAHVLFPRD